MTRLSFIHQASPRWLLIFVLFISFGVSAVQPAYAACPSFPHTVPASNVADLVNAMNCANTNGSGTNDVINLTAGSTYTLTAAVSDIDGLPPVAAGNGTLTINGNGATITRSSALGTTNLRLLSVNSGANLTINNLTLSNGLVNFQNGGAIANNGGTLTVVSSIFSGNNGTNSNGAAISSSGTLFVINSVFVGNHGGAGGGMIVFDGSARVNDSTFSANSTVVGGADIAAQGAASVTVNNSILANSSGGVECAFNSGVSSVIQNTLIEDGTCHTTNGVNGNKIGDPLLTNDLTNLTPQPGSIAINAGDNSLAVDQNSTPLVYDVRGAGFPRKLGGTVDMGAYESCALGFPYTVPAGDTTDLINTMTCANMNGAGTNDTINLTAGSTYTLTTANNNDGSASNALPVIVSGNGSLTINGNGATIARSSASQFRLFRVISGANLTITGLTLSNGNVISTNFGGAITNVGGTVTVLSSVFRDNQGAAGGSLYSSGTLVVTNSIFVHNNATSGGGIAIAGGTLQVNDSTFSANSASNTGASIIVTSATSITVNNSILSNGTAGAECASNVAVTVQNSLIEDGSCGITNGVSGNKTGDPSLSNDLTDLTLLLDSPALNAGDNSLIPGGVTTDLAGNARISVGTVDMGAYERNYTPDFVVDTTSDANLNVCTPAPANCSLRGAINLANSIGGADTITFSTAVFNPGTITLTSNLPIISDDASILGLGATLTHIDGAGSYQPFYISSGPTVNFSGLTITHGSGSDGGAMLNEGDVTVSNSVFSGNTANNGGAIFVNFGSLTVINSAFSGNSATTGGAIGSQAALTISNSTFSGNSASVYGGGIIVFDGTATLNNSIIANTTEGGDCLSNVTVDAQNSLIEDGSCDVTSGVNGNLTGDPALTDDLTDLTLQPSSIAINMGSNSLIPNGITTDLAGNARIVGSTVDMGAYEAVAVCPSFPHTVPASDVADLILSITCANASASNNVINLTASTYTLTAVNNTQVIFAGGNGLPAIRDAASAGTLTINGNGATIARSSAGGTPEFRLFYVNSLGNLTLDRVTLTNGLVNGFGGGAIISLGTLTLTNSTVTSNSASFAGGIYQYGNTLTIVNSTVSNNMAQSYGGGIATDTGSTFKLINSTVSDNSVITSGSGNGAGAFDLYFSTTTIINSTIANNTAADATRSGLWLDSAGTLTIQNSIVANNNGANNCVMDSGATFNDGGNNLDNGTSCGFGGSVGQNTNPLLGALANNGGPTQTLALQSGSPAINAGSNALAVDQNGAALTTDQRGAGFPRIAGNNVDMGSFEAPAPIIQTQPQDQLINSGQTATLSVSATGDPTLTYQWYRGSGPDTSSPVGTNSNKFTTPALTTTTAYWVRISNSFGSVDSNTATITPTKVPVITVQPQSSTISGGKTATLSVTVLGSATLTYQWYQGTAPDTSHKVGSNANKFTTPGLTRTTSYWVRISNSSGHADSDTVTITVGSPILTTQPQSQIIVSGQTATLNVVATGVTALTYQWYQGTAPSTSLPVGTNSDSFTTSALTSTTHYWVRISNSFGQVNSSTATITPTTVPKITTQPQSQNLVSGQTTTLNVGGVGSAPLTYQWYQGSAPSTSLPVGTNSPSFTTPALTSKTAYWVRISNSFGQVNSATATITVGTVPILTTQPQSQLITSGKTATLTVTATGSATLTYHWYRGTAPDTSHPVGTNANKFTTPALTTTTSYWVRVSNNFGQADSNTVTITTTQVPVITVQPLDQMISGGKTATLSVTVLGSSTLTYHWYLGTAPDTSHPVGTNANKFTTPGLTATASYWVRISNSFGSVDSNTVTITPAIVPVITVQPLDQTISSGKTATLKVTVLGSATLTYHWYLGVAPDTGHSVGTNSSSFTTPTLTTTTPYWVRISNSFGTVDSNTATITIGTPIITTQPQSQTIASGQTATLSVVASGTAPLTYQWYRGTVPSTSNKVGTNSSSFTTPALTSTTSYWVRVSNSFGQTNSSTATITIQPGGQSVTTGQSEALITDVPAASSEAPTETPTVEIPTETSAAPTEAPTLEVSPTMLPTALPFPTLPPPPEATELPTALPFPTLPPPASPTVQQTSISLPLPAIATMDDGAPDWLPLSGWTLDGTAAYSGQGLGWHVSAANQVDLLRWNRSLDLSSVLPRQTIQLSYQSLLTSQQSSASVQLSLDGVTWQTVGTATSTGQWTQENIDLSAYIGDVVQIQFLWQGVVSVDATQAVDSWLVDNVEVAAASATLTGTLAGTEMPSETSPMTPTVSNTGTATPTATLESPTDTPTVTDAPTDTPAPTTAPTATPEPSEAATEGT